jgi:hypothetical protein
MALDDAARDRARAVGDAIQHAVAARPDVAVSPMGMGLDTLSTLLRNSPDVLEDFGPTLALAVDAYNYVVAGVESPGVAGLLAGDLPI